MLTLVLLFSLAAVSSLLHYCCSGYFTYLPSECYNSQLPQKRCSLFGDMLLEVTLRASNPSQCKGRYHTKVYLMPTTHWGYRDNGGYQDQNRQTQLEQGEKCAAEAGKAILKAQNPTPARCPIHCPPPKHRQTGPLTSWTTYISSLHVLLTLTLPLLLAAGSALPLQP